MRGPRSATKWVGSHVIVVDGVTIGEHCVICAGAVATKDLSSWTVAAANPDRPLRDRHDTGARVLKGIEEKITAAGERLMIACSG